MFRIGGGVDSQGTGITSGMDTPRRGLVTEPGGYAGKTYDEYLESIPGLLEELGAGYGKMKSQLGPLALLKIASSGVLKDIRTPWDIPGKLTESEVLDPTMEGLSMLPKIELKEKEHELTTATTMAKLLKPKDEPSMFSTRMKSETRIAAIQDKIRDLQKQKIDTTGLSGDNLAKAEKANESIDLQIADWRMRRRAYISGGSLRQQALSIFYGDTMKGKAGGQPTEEDLQEIMQWLEPGNAAGGTPNRVNRVGYQEGVGPNIMDQGAPVVDQGATIQPAAVQQQPEQQDPYQILRQRLPADVPDEVVKLIAYNKEAFQDFANIQTQDDITAFNDKYGVSLVIDVGSV